MSTLALFVRNRRIGLELTQEEVASRMEISSPTTIGNIERIKKYCYLKNGAMYSVFILGLIMLADAFSHHIPEWVSPISTMLIIGYFFLKSRKVISTL